MPRLNSRPRHCISNLVLLTICLMAPGVGADVIETSDTGFVIERELTIPGAPEAVFDLFTQDLLPWWDHHFSESPKAMYIEAKPGGGFFEIFDDEGNGARHAVVTASHRGKLLRFQGPLGLAGYAIDMVHTLRFEATDTGDTRLGLSLRAAGEVQDGWPETVDRVWAHFLEEQFLPFATSRFAGSERAGVEEVCVLETSKGKLVFRFFEDEAPVTTAHIKALVNEGFYDGQPFYRVVAGHVIQAGDGGESERPTVKGEFGAHPHVTGAVGLARGEDRNSGSTEIYICLAERSHLDGKYAIFGLLVDGFDVLERIGAVEVEEQYLGEAKVAFHRPIEPVIIHRAFLEKQTIPGARGKTD